jgi:hypothetical protein
MKKAIIFIFGIFCVLYAKGQSVILYNPVSQDVTPSTVQSTFDLYGPNGFAHYVTKVYYQGSLVGQSNTDSVFMSGNQALYLTQIADTLPYGNATYTMRVFATWSNGQTDSSTAVAFQTAPNPQPMTISMTQTGLFANHVVMTLNGTAVGTYQKEVYVKYRTLNPVGPWYSTATTPVTDTYSVPVTVGPLSPSTQYEFMGFIKTVGIVPGVPSPVPASSLTYTTLSVAYAYATTPTVASGIDSARVSTTVTLGTSPNATVTFKRYLNNVLQPTQQIVVSASGPISTTFTSLQPNTIYKYQVSVTDGIHVDTTARVTSTTQQIPTPLIVLDSLVKTKTSATAYFSIIKRGNWPQSPATFSGSWSGQTLTTSPFGPFPVTADTQHVVVQKTGLTPNTLYQISGTAINLANLSTSYGPIPFTTLPPFSAAVVNTSNTTIYSQIAALKVTGLECIVLAAGDQAQMFRVQRKTTATIWDTIPMPTLTVLGALGTDSFPCLPGTAYEWKYLTKNSDNIPWVSPLLTGTTLQPEAPNITTSVNGNPMNSNPTVLPTGIVFNVGGSAGGYPLQASLVLKNLGTGQTTPISPSVTIGPDLVGYNWPLTQTLAPGEYKFIVTITGSDVGTMMPTEEFTVATTLGVDEEAFDKVLVYPNPVSATSPITISGIPRSVKTIQVTDVTGRTLSQVNVMTSTLVLDAPQATGIYFVSLIKADGTRIIKKINIY